MAQPAAFHRAPPEAPRRWSLSIGRVAGIDLRVHVSFLALVALFAFGTGGPDGPGMWSAMSWLLLLFACVVVHELAHCVVGRRRGAVVHEILLLPIGGMSRMERMPRDPDGELAMAIAGPLASFGLGASAGVLAWSLGIPLLPVSFVTGSLLVRLCWVNLILGAFNLLPAFPLDGGRVLRAWFARRGDELAATRRAARIGRAVALAMIVTGVFADLWLVIIGMFVSVAATMEERAAIQHMYLRGVQVAQLMHQLEPESVPDAAIPPDDALSPDDDVEADLLALATAPAHRLPVVDHGHVVGELALDDVDAWLRACLRDQERT